MKVDIAVSLCLDVEGTMHLAPCVHAYKSQLSPLHVILSNHSLRCIWIPVPMPTNHSFHVYLSFFLLIIL